MLRGGKSGPIAIRAGDQFLEVGTAPAHIQLPFGINADQRDLMSLLDEEAPVIAAAEEERADIVLDASLDGSAELEELDDGGIDDELVVDEEADESR